MTADASKDDRERFRAARLRVLVILRGDEPDGWGDEACRAVAMWTNPIVRVLAVPLTPCPPFTSCAPYARQLYNGARAAWRQHEEFRIRGVLDRMMPAFPRGAEVIWMPPFVGDVAAMIVRHAHEWAADVVVIGGPRPGVSSWVSPGAVHVRVLRRVACAVLIPRAPARASLARLRVLPHLRVVSSARRLFAQGEA